MEQGSDEGRAVVEDAQPVIELKEHAKTNVLNPLLQGALECVER